MGKLPFKFEVNQPVTILQTILTLIYIITAIHTFQHAKCKLQYDYYPFFSIGMSLTVDVLHHKLLHAFKKKEDTEKLKAIEIIKR